MMVKDSALPSLLKKRRHALYVLIGQDPYRLNEAALHIKSLFLNQGDCSQTIIDIQTPSDWDRLIAEANSYSLFSEWVLLDARWDKKSIDATGKERLTTYLAEPNDQCLIIIRAPNLPVKSLQWLSEHQNALVVHIIPFTPALLKQWLQSQLNARGLHADPEAIHLIQQLTQGNMLATAQLVEKLSLCTVQPGEFQKTPNTAITADLIRDHLSDQSHFEIYDLAEAFLNANAHHTLRLLRQFQFERVEPTLILWILTQEIRRLIQLHYSLKQSHPMNQACQTLNIWSSRIPIYAKATARLSIAPLLRLLHQCQQLDEMIKTTQSVQIWNQLDSIALSLCEAPS